jgi:hypothetical protein
MPKVDSERLRAILPASSLGMMTAAFIIAKTGRDALFFQGNGVFQLPVATMMIAAASLPLAMIFVKAMKTWGARLARIGIMLFGAAVLALSAPLLETADSPLLFYIFILPSIFGIMFASLWLLASDLLENTAKPLAARAFSRIAASSLGGGMVGGFIAKALVPLMEPKWLVLLGALMIVPAAGLAVLAHRRFPTAVTPKSARALSGETGYLAPLRNRYALTLLFIAMTGALAGLMIDVQFYISATSANMGAKGNAKFFANFYIMLNFSSLLLQLFAAPKIQDKIGIRAV